MLMKLLNKMEDPKRPLLGPNVKVLRFWGLLLPKSIPMKYFYMTMHVLVILFVITEFMDVYDVRSDINSLLNNMKISLLANVSVCKIITFLLWSKKWRKIIDYVTKADLMQRNKDVVKSKFIAKYTRYSRIVTYLYWSLVYGTLLIVMFHPLLKYILSPSYRQNVRNGTEKYLEVASSWVPFDKNTNWGYLLASIYQSYASIYGVGWFTSFDTNAMVIMVFFKSEFQMIRAESAKIFEEYDIDSVKVLDRLRECQRRHLDLIAHAEIFDSCLSPIMLLYMMVCSIMLCVTSYQITLQTSGMEKFLAAEYLVFNISQLFMYCWHSNEVLEASRELMRGPYQSAWWDKNAKSQRNIYLLVEQFRRVVDFHAGPLNRLNIESFIKILKGAYSYYTLLRQSQETH